VSDSDTKGNNLEWLLIGMAPATEWGSFCYGWPNHRRTQNAWLLFMTCWEKDKVRGTVILVSYISCC